MNWEGRRVVYRSQTGVNWHSILIQQVACRQRVRSVSTKNVGQTAYQTTVMRALCII